MGENMPSSSRVQVMPAQQDDAIYLSNSQVVLMNGDDALTLDEQADIMRANKDKFKCLYLLVETAIAMRQRDSDQQEIQYIVRD